MSLIHKIADYLDASRVHMLKHHNDIITVQSTAISELRGVVEANGQTVERLGDAAMNITKLRTAIKALRDELFVARSYVIDASDELDEQLAALPVRSKKRAPTEATLAAVHADLKRIADTLASTSAL